MTNAMRKFMEQARHTARCLPALGLAALLTCGCAARSGDVVAETPKLEAPVVHPDGEALPNEETSLQRYQEVNQLYQAEKNRSAGLETELAQQQAGRRKAEAENEGLHKQVETLTAKAAELDAMKSKLDEAQKAGLAMENMLRDARHDLLAERLAGVKRDETIVALKIERAKDARRMGATPYIPPAAAAADGSAAKDPPPAPAARPAAQAAIPAGAQAVADKGVEIAKP